MCENIVTDWNRWKRYEKQCNDENILTFIFVFELPTLKFLL